MSSAKTTRTMDTIAIVIPTKNIISLLACIDYVLVDSILLIIGREEGVADIVDVVDNVKECDDDNEGSTEIEKMLVPDACNSSDDDDDTV